MFEVNTGLYSGANLEDQKLMQFADINSDMFTDIITVDKDRQTIIIHIFDSFNNKFQQKVSFKPYGCNKITNVAVGRSDKTLRLFVTCFDANKKTILKMYDRNMNNELGNTVQTTKQSDNDDQPATSKNVYDKIIDTMTSNNNMVFK